MPNTTYLNLPYPSLSSAPNVPQDMQNLAGAVDALAAPIICTSSTRPPGRDGAMIYETDTRRYMTYNSALAAWLVHSSNERLFARKSGTQAASSTSLVVDTELQVPTVANAMYHVTALIFYSGNASADIRILFRTPTSGTFQGVGHVLVGGAVSQTELQAAPVTGNASDVWGILAGGAAYGRVEGLLINAANAGNFGVEFAQNAANATASNVLAGSFLMLRRVA